MPARVLCAHTHPAPSLDWEDEGGGRRRLDRDVDAYPIKSSRATAAYSGVSGTCDAMRLCRRLEQQHVRTSATARALTHNTKPNPMRASER